MDYVKLEKKFYEHKWQLVKDWKRERNPYLKKQAGIEGNLALKLIKKHIKKGKVLDIGCGGGRNSILFANNGFTVSGVDFSKEAIKLAKLNDLKSKVNFKIGNVLNLKQKNYFDTILDFGCFHHMRKSQWKKYIQNTIKVLKPNSYFILYAFSTESQKTSRFDPKTKRNWAIFRGHYYHYFSKSEIKEVFSKYFKIISTKLIKEKGRKLAFYLTLMQKR